ncbi:MAG: DNA polymerase III subunit delta [Parcubacteria group bacterium]
MILFLYGEDAFSSKRKVAEIKQKYLNSDKSGSGLSVFDCDHASVADKVNVKNIVSVINTPNLLAPKRLLIIKDFVSATLAEEQKELLTFLKKKDRNLGEDSDVVVVFWEGSQPKKSGALYKFLEKNAKSQHFEKLSGVKLQQWVLKNLVNVDPTAKISKSALEKLIAYCGEDNFILFSEMQKLASYANGQMIEEKDVEKLVRAKIDGNIFAMVDAIGANNKKQALGMLHKHLEKGDDPFYILSMFFYQFRNMLKVADLKEQGMPEHEIARATKLHPFVVKKSLSQVSRLPLAKLKTIYQKLGELDTEVKTGKIEIKLGLDKFVVEL